MKLAHSPADSTSVTRRPSRNDSTSPNTIPSGRPFKNKRAQLYGAGVHPNSTRHKCAKAINNRMPTARRVGGSSAITRMPINLEIV